MLYEVITGRYTQRHRLKFLGASAYGKLAQGIVVIIGRFRSDLIQDFCRKSIGSGTHIGIEIQIARATVQITVHIGLVIVEIDQSDGEIDRRITSYNVCYTKLLRRPGMVRIRLKSGSQSSRSP